MRYPGFIGPAYRSQSKVVAADELVNLYVEKVEGGTGAANYVAYSAPGFREYCDLGVDDECRGIFNLNGATFAVYGSKLYQLPFVRGGTATELASGISNPDDSIVSIAGNGDGGFQLVIASAGTLYCYDIRTGGITQIPDLQASFVTFINGSFYALDPSTSNLYVSAVEDGSTWDPSDVLQRSDTPDKWIALLLVGGELWAFGAQTSSVLSDTNGTDFPLTQNPVGKIPHGTCAPNSPALLGGKPIWVADDLTVRLGQGYQAQRVSTHAIEYALRLANDAGAIGDAEGTVFTHQGHEFYALDLPTFGKTWYYDGTSGLWGQFSGPFENDFTVRDVRGYAHGNGTHLVGSRSDGLLYEMSAELYTDTDGTGLHRRRTAPHISEEGIRIRYNSLEIHAQTGVGLTTGQGSNPLGMLSWSNDGGESFGNVYTASLGPIGRTVRVVWRRLTTADDRVFRFDYSEPTALTLVDAFLKLRGGRS